MNYVITQVNWLIWQFLFIKEKRFCFASQTNKYYKFNERLDSCWLTYELVEGTKAKIWYDVSDELSCPSKATSCIPHDLIPHGGKGEEQFPIKMAISNQYNLC